MIPAKGKYYFTSESVTEGHPDKVADRISDAILDTLLAQDPDSHVACETLVTTGMAMIAGEITTSGYADLPGVVRETIRNIGYTSSDMGFDAQTCAVISSIDKQSPDIAQGVNRTKPEEQGAGDQGMMFGFASNETETLMPAPIYWAHQLSLQLARVRRDGVVDFFRPDGKTQVSFEYVDGKPVRINNVVVATQHAPHVSQADVVETVKREVMEEVGLHVKNLRYYKSQPWSFSDTLLMGFFAEVEGDDSITLDREELALAEWFERENIPASESDISLTSEMIEFFRAGK